MKKVLLGGVAAAAVALGIAAPTAGAAHADYLDCWMGCAPPGGPVALASNLIWGWLA